MHRRALLLKMTPAMATLAIPGWAGRVLAQAKPALVPAPPPVGGISVLNEDLTKLSPSVVNSMTSSFTTYNLKAAQGTATAADAAAYAQSLGTYLGNLQETGWNSALDQYLASNPNSFLNFTVSTSQAQTLATRLSGYGLTTITSNYIVQNSIFSQADKQLFLTQNAQAGSASLFRQAGSMISSSLQANVSRTTDRLRVRYERRVQEKSGSCRLIALLMVISILTGNEVAAAVCAGALAAYC